MKVPTAYDYTDNKGYDWIATDNVISLVDDKQLWKYFAGAWGEVGEWSTTTGPLGPWQKCDERSKLARKHYNPDIKSLIGENQVLLVIDYSKKYRSQKKKAKVEPLLFLTTRELIFYVLMRIAEMRMEIQHITFLH